MKLTTNQERMLRRAIGGLERMPDRYRYADLRGARAREPYTLPEVRAAFEGVEEGYARLGPYSADEPLMRDRGEKTEAYSQLCQEVYHQGPKTQPFTSPVFFGGRGSTRRID